MAAEESDGGFDLGEQGSADEFGYRRVDNITDDIAAVYSEALDGPVDKDDIFYSVYAQLHDPGYRTRYAADLKKMLPRIPLVEDAAPFVDAGRSGNRRRRKRMIRG